MEAKQKASGLARFELRVTQHGRLAPSLSDGPVTSVDRDISEGWNAGEAVRAGSRGLGDHLDRRQLNDVVPAVVRALPAPRAFQLRR